MHAILLEEEASSQVPLSAKCFFFKSAAFSSHILPTVCALSARSGSAAAAVSVWSVSSTKAAAHITVHARSVQKASHNEKFTRVCVNNTAAEVGRRAFKL